MNKIIAFIITLSISSIAIVASDSIPSIPSAFSRSVQWRIGAEFSPGWIPGTNGFLKGSNPEGKNIDATFSANVRSDFSFNPTTREGILYKGLYQGIGIGANTFFANSLLGSPISVYVYQGSPIVNLSGRLSLGYEWQFGAAFGWKHYNQENSETNAVVSTPVTAHIGIGLNLRYTISERLQMSFGLNAKHYSNGNTSWPNAGVNSIGATIGIAYILNPQKSVDTDNSIEIIPEADRGHWLFDIMAYGAWRKRIVSIGVPAEPQLCPGKFGVLGFQFSPLRQLNRWVAVGPALDFQWDESAGLEPYWINGTTGDMIKFKHPPFGKQISAGISVHAELTMPIFSVNAGLGYDIINPKGNRAFYQSLSLKTFITKKIYLNIGYRLGSFKEPQNLMLGVGVRI